MLAVADPTYSSGDIYSITNNTPFYDPTDGCPTSTVSSGGVSSGGSAITGNLQSLAQQILSNSSVSFDGGKNGPTGTQFQRLANGQKAQTDDGRSVDVEPIILVVVLHIAQSHKVNLSALTDGSSHTSPSNPHGSGKAVDINILDGSHTTGTDSVADKIINSAAEVLPDGARFGLGDNGGAATGSKTIGSKTFGTFQDHPTHVHVDVLGVSQAKDDAAVQAAGGGATSGGAGSATQSANGGSVFILGDSIAVKSEAAYKQAFQAKGVSATVDGSTSRSLNGAGISGNMLSGMDAIKHDSTAIQSASSIIIALGTNDGDTPSTIDNAISAIKAINPSAKLFWVDIISVDRADNFNSLVIGPGNQAIYAKAAKDGYSVLSWFKTVAPKDDPQHPTAKETDANGYITPISQDNLGVHPTPKGSTALAQLVADEVTGGAPSSASDNTTPKGCCASGGTSSPVDTTGVTTLRGADNEEKIYNYFLDKGLTPLLSAAIVGNFQQESTWNPEAVESPPGTSKDPHASGSSGWGIAQWTPGYGVIDIAKTLKITGPIYELATQLDIVWGEMNTVTPPGYRNFIKPFKQMTDLAQATGFFTLNFERAGIVGPRFGDATTALAKYSGNAAVKGSSSSTPATPATCASPTANAPSASAGDIKAYNNPLRDVKNLVKNRIDQGVDYTGSGPVYAIGSGQVVNVSNGGWTGIGSTPTFIVYKLDPNAGPAHDKYVYFAEGCTPKVSIGDKVTSDKVICDMLPGANSVETGWADGTRIGDAAAHDVWVNHDSTSYYTAYGENFSQLMVKLHAPPGTIAAGAQKLGSLPAGWPTW